MKRKCIYHLQGSFVSCKCSLEIPKIHGDIQLDIHPHCSILSYSAAVWSLSRMWDSIGEKQDSAAEPERNVWPFLVVRGATCPEFCPGHEQIVPLGPLDHRQNSGHGAFSSYRTFHAFFALFGHFLSPRITSKAVGTKVQENIDSSSF